MPWSPLAFGLLTGKYDRAAVEAGGERAGGPPTDAAAKDEQRPEDDKRLDGANPFGDTLFTAKNWAIVDELKRVADSIGQPSARVALAWVLAQPGVKSPLLGVSKVEQLQDNLVALDLKLGVEHEGARRCQQRRPARCMRSRGADVPACGLRRQRGARLERRQIGDRPWPASSGTRPAGTAASTWRATYICPTPSMRPAGTPRWSSSRQAAA